MRSPRFFDLIFLVGLPVTVALVFMTTTVIYANRYATLRDQVDRACSGKVAQLDLSEWVPLCLMK